MTLDLRTELERYGVGSGDVVDLGDAASARANRYLDLLSPRNQRVSAATGDKTQKLLPSSVVEHDGEALIYVIDCGVSLGNPIAEPDAGQVAQLIRRLACRGLDGYLAIIGKGSIRIYPVALTEKAVPSISVTDDSENAPLVVDCLVRGTLGVLDASYDPQSLADRKAVSDTLFDLLRGAFETLAKSGVLSQTGGLDQVLALVGRALFARFLVDRGILHAKSNPALFAQGAPETFLSTPALAAKLFGWLDVTFNGELLPMLEQTYPTEDEYRDFLTDRDGKAPQILKALTDIMFRAVNGQLSLEFVWGGLDFAHIPVGVLSEVYEEYAHQNHELAAKRHSVRYTPRRIAELTVDQAFNGFQKDDRKHISLLDPSCGAGVFLVLGLRRLVEENWIDGVAPDAKKIRELLYTKIRGFDINHSALTLSALSLYLVALEVDPNAGSAQSLKFKKLLGSVLRDVSMPKHYGEADDCTLGSLGPNGNFASDDERVSLVIGNAPWSDLNWSGVAAETPEGHPGRRISFSDLVEIEVDEIRQQRLDASVGYKHPDKAPDLAFLWKSLKWAKPGGMIALIVEGGLLYRRTDKSAIARDELFRCMTVTGILNGVELSVPMWGNLGTPFAVIFGRNEPAKAGNKFVFTTPTADVIPGGHRIRFDSASTSAVANSDLEADRSLLKVRYLGTTLDANLMAMLNALCEPTSSKQEPAATRIGEFWCNSRTMPKDSESEVLPPIRGSGYTKGGASRSVKSFSDEFLATNPLHFTTKDKQLRVIREEDLKPFPEDLKLLTRGDERLYQPPLVLVGEAVTNAYARVKALLYLGQRNLVFNESYGGYSTAGLEHAGERASVLALVLGSDLFSYYVLMTSAKLAVDRRPNVYHMDVNHFPMIRFERLSAEQRGEVERLVKAMGSSMTKDEETHWRDEVNALIYDLYDLGDEDVQVIDDCLEMMLPISTTDNKRKHRVESTDPRIGDFSSALQSELAPFFDPTGQQIAVNSVRTSADRNWLTFDIHTAEPVSTHVAANSSISKLGVALALDSAATHVFIEGTQCLRLIVRNERRYITRSRARLFALEVLQSHGRVFPLQA